MNTEAQIETMKRERLVNAFVEEITDKAVGVILVGSLAYAPNVNVKKESDIDLIVVYDDIKECASDYFKEDGYLKKESYDGYLVKRHENIGHTVDLKSKNIDDLNISIHNINYSALQKISYGNYETLAYYRQSQKGTTYYSKDFDGNIHPFKPECLSVNDQIGERRIDKVAFQSDKGDYVIGNDIDKLLSGAKVIYDTDGRIQDIIDQTWKNVTKKLVEHRIKHNQNIDANMENLAPLLFRYNRFSEETKKEIKEKTKHGVELALTESKEGYERINKLKQIIKGNERR